MGNPGTAAGAAALLLHQAAAMPTVLVAGATGRLGRPLVAELAARGLRVRALARDAGRHLRMPGAAEHRAADVTRPGTLRGACDGVDAVISCVGAPLSLGLGDRTPHEAVDFRGNLALLEEARRAGVRRFVYVSVFGGRDLRALAYADAHERFADALAASSLDWAVVRPTGYFSFLRELLVMAHAGRGVVVAAGDAVTNPIHEADLAAFCADALEGAERDLPVGGPRSHTRREMVEMAFRALGSVPRVRSVPAWALRLGARTLRPVNPRVAALVRFGVEVSLRPVVAPAFGERTLGAYFDAEARAMLGQAPEDAG